MNILAIDTSTKKAGVAIKKDDNIISKYIDNEITHSEKLLPLIDEVLNETSLSLKEIDILACVLGPGSFTGVRIGIATMKAISKVIGKNIISTTSLKLLGLEALKTNKARYVLTLMDAKNDRVYYELFENVNNELISLSYNGNNFISSVIDEIKLKKLDDLIIIIDNITLKDKINMQDANVQKVDLNLENIFSLVNDKNSYTYLNLDALYYRKSEAERTKDGE